MVGLTLLLLATQAKQTTIPEEAYLGGYLESAIGLKLHPTTVFSQCISRISRPRTDLSGYYDLNPKDAMAKEPTSVGFSASKVSRSVYEGKPCLLFESDAARNKRRDYKNSDGINVINITPVQRYRKVWISENGTPLFETSGYRSGSGTYELKATFKGDEVEIEVAGPKGKRTATIYPAGGVELFANEFKPMIDGEKVLVKEKSFSRLDPVTGGVVKIQAKVGGKFTGSLFTKRFEGHRIDFTFDGREQIGFVTFDMDLLQVNLPYGETLFAQTDPTDGKGSPTRIKTGGS